MCPHCRQNAPLVYRGMNAFCTACGGPRTPLVASSINLAGRPSKVGGTVARVLGWLVLAFGWITALVVGGILFAAFGSASIAHWLVGVPIALIATAIAYGLLKSGRQLHDSGALEEMTTRNQAIFALANTRGGVLTAADLAQAISTSPIEADAVLTKLAKEYPDHVSLDIDDEGRVLYRFPSVHWRKMRVAAPDRPIRVESREPREPLEEELELDPRTKASRA